MSEHPSEAQLETLRVAGFGPITTLNGLLFHRVGDVNTYSVEEALALAAGADEEHRDG